MSAEHFSDSGSRIELLTSMSGGWSHGIVEGNEDAIDGCRDPMLSPQGPFPGFVSNPYDTKSVPDVPNGGCTELESNGMNDAYNSMPDNEKKLEQHENEFCSMVGTDNTLVRSGGSIAERRAAKFGFDASKINTSSLKSSSTLASPSAQSPYLLRTPGISPSALLESPIMLPNLLPSPTTGTFGLPHWGCESGTINSASSKIDKDKDSDDTSSFTFKPHGKPVSLSCYSSMQNQHPPKNFAHSLSVGVDIRHPDGTHPPMTVAFEFPTHLPGEATVNSSKFNSPPDSKISCDISVKANTTDFQLSHSVGAAGVEIEQNKCNQQEDIGLDHALDEDQKVMDSLGGTLTTSEDGYNWRKYGQKQVKGSEFPRSYYKCTHPSCPVKKKVEHSYDGQITEIVYKGAHNHPKPQPNRSSTFSISQSCDESLKVGEGGGSVKEEGGTVWRDLQLGCDNLKLGSDSRPDGLERTCSTSITTEISDPLPANEEKSVGALESAGTPELSSTLASDEEEDEDAAPQGSLLITDYDNNEPDFKKRKMEDLLNETALASRAVREPRVIVQIESEVDILDDGYRWRKYGQKVVKGNPNPRSYYKCTHPGCTVRKHVERASHNLKCVLTTYEGKHNHEVPTARNSSHASTVGGNSAPSVPNSQETLSLPRNTHLPKSEPQDVAHSNRKVEYNKDFLRPNYLGNFASGAASIYQMKFPTWPNPMLYGAFGVTPNCESSTAPMGPTIPGLSIAPPIGFSMSSNLTIPNNSQGRPLGMVQPMFFGQPKEGDVKLLRPMQD